MWNIVICDGDKVERDQLVEYVEHCCAGNGWEASVRVCADWPELYGLLGEAEPDVIVMAQDGVAGIDTITSIHLPSAKIIWFSDLNFGQQAYRLCLSWFNMKPVTYDKMEQALTRCWEEQPGAVGVRRQAGGPEPGDAGPTPGRDPRMPSLWQRLKNIGRELL